MGDVENVKADLVALLRAARIVFPEKAAAVSTAAADLATEIDRLNPESARAGDPKVLRDALRFCGDVHDGLRKLVEGLNYCSTGLIQVVENYRNSDAEGAAAFSQIGAELTQGPAPAPAPVPADIGNPQEYGAGPVSRTPRPHKPENMIEEHDEELESQSEPGFPELPL